MTSTEGNESHEPSRGLLAGGHPLPSFRPHKYRNCISRSAVMDEHPRPVSPKPGETRTGQPFELILGAKGPASPKESKSVEPHVLKTREAYAIRPRPTSGYTYAQIIKIQRRGSPSCLHGSLPQNSPKTGRHNPFHRIRNFAMVGLALLGRDDEGISGVSRGTRDRCGDR